MSINLTKIIDDEDIVLDSQKLAEFKSNGKLKQDIDDVVENFIDENIFADDFESITIIYQLVNKIKKLL